MQWIHPIHILLSYKLLIRIEGSHIGYPLFLLGTCMLFLDYNFLTVYDIDTRYGRCLNAATEEVIDAHHYRCNSLDILNTSERIELALSLSLLHQGELPVVSTDPCTSEWSLTSEQVVSGNTDSQVMLCNLYSDGVI